MHSKLFGCSYLTITQISLIISPIKLVTQYIFNSKMVLLIEL
jgi:hypothetical protein